MWSSVSSAIAFTSSGFIFCVFLQEGLEFFESAPSLGCGAFASAAVDPFLELVCVYGYADAVCARLVWSCRHVEFENLL